MCILRVFNSEDGKEICAVSLIDMSTTYHMAGATVLLCSIWLMNIQGESSSQTVLDEFEGQEKIIPSENIRSCYSNT